MVKFIRCYWGNLDSRNGEHRDEIINVSKVTNLNEYVYVWGVDNFNFITSLGFECELVSENPFPYGPNLTPDFYIAKLDAIKLGCQKFSEVVFLDWDTRQLKNVDSEFFTLLTKHRIGIQMPLYIYDFDYARRVLSEDPGMEQAEVDYMFRHSEELKVFSFRWNEHMVSPNAGFVFCSDSRIIDELIHLCKRFDIQSCNEEMSMMILSRMNCNSIEDYIKIYEPLVCSIDPSRVNQDSLNSFIDSVAKKDSYFCHMF
jgi:hypothetical protein